MGDVRWDRAPVAAHIGVRIRALEGRMDRAERSVSWLKHHVDRLQWRSSELAVILWVLDLIFSFLLGTVLFVAWVATVIWDVTVLFALYAGVGFFRRYVADALFAAILETLKVALDAWSGVVSVIRGLIGAINSGVGIFGAHISRRKLPKPYHIHDLLPDDVYGFLDDPRGFCATRTTGLEFVWGAIVRYSSPETCNTCAALSLSPTLEWACEPIFFGTRMYHFEHNACRISAADWMCQALYLDKLIAVLLVIMFMFGVYLAYGRFLHDVFQLVWEMLKLLVDQIITVSRVLTTRHPHARWKHMHELRLRARARMLRHLPPRVRHGYKRAAKTPLVGARSPFD